MGSDNPVIPNGFEVNVATRRREFLKGFSGFWAGRDSGTSARDGPGLTGAGKLFNNKKYENATLAIENFPQDPLASRCRCVSSRCLQYGSQSPQLALQLPRGVYLTTR